MVACLLILSWVAFVCNLIKYFLLHTGVQLQANILNDDWQVWPVVEARLEPSEELAIQAKERYSAGLGLFLDLLFGSVSTVFIAVVVEEAEPWVFEQLATQKTLVYGLTGFVGYQILPLVWQLIDHRFRGGRNRPVKLRAVGVLGVGLFLMMFLILGGRHFSGEHADPLLIGVFLASGGLILLGLANAVGLVRLWREAQWLKAYLQQRQGDVAHADTRLLLRH